MSFSSILLYCTGIFISITRECACDWHEEDSGKHVFCLQICVHDCDHSKYLFQAYTQIDWGFLKDWAPTDFAIWRSVINFTSVVPVTAPAKDGFGPFEF